MLGIDLLGAGATLAEESPSVVDPVQQREQIREQFQERMRSMTPEEQKFMRGGYGRGYESRQGGGGRGMGDGRNR